MTVALFAFCLMAINDALAQAPPNKPQLWPVFDANVAIATLVGGVMLTMNGTIHYDETQGVHIDMNTMFFSQPVRCLFLSFFNCFSWFGRVCCDSFCLCAVNVRRKTF